MKILTAAEMREVDRLSTERHGVPSLDLMENAGKNVAEFVESRFPDFARRHIVVICGKGNNGGDGFVVARHLLEMGAKPSVYLIGDPAEVKGDAATNLKRWETASGKIHVIREPGEWQAAKVALSYADVVVDALLGTGVRGPAEGLLGEVIGDVNRVERPVRSAVIAVDIPSGLPADSGGVKGAVIQADYTVTFTAPKPGMVSGEGASRCGQIVVRAIGSPPELIEEIGKGTLRWLDAREVSIFAMPRESEGHKGDYGHALIVAGSVGKSGAAVLASWAALRAGAGLVTVATPAPVLPIVAAHTPEVMTEPLPATETGSISFRGLDKAAFETLLKGKRVLAMGPGLSTHNDTQRFVRDVVGKHLVPIILDADGLNAFAGRARDLKHATDVMCLTPHPGEMARLLECTAKEVQARRVELARKAAAEWNAIVILKGHGTVIASPDGNAFVNSTGNPGMATGGTGDVLTGMLAGVTAQFGVTPWWRILAFGVYLHGLAGDIAYAESGGAPLMASDLIHAIPRAYQKFYAACSRV
ncbi:MAG TPA: NAD(P)H-hydrate dehydratase [Candidatus Acidoferrales bacterium]|nr:NAD(P)H-hydrate dehydratase [Candidatus Acidoferrales bacterium]